MRFKQPICADEMKECDVLVCHYPKHCEIKYANNNNNNNVHLYSAFSLKKKNKMC